MNECHSPPWLPARGGRRWWAPFTIPHFGPALFARTLGVWLALRGVIAAMTVAMKSVLRVSPLTSLVLPPSAALAVVLVVVTVSAVSLRRRNEDLLFLCLGFGRLRVLSLLATLILGVEILIGILAWTVAR